MEENKFEDLVLENDNKKNKQKQIVFKIIIFVIIALIVLIVVKIFNNTNSNSQKAPLPQMQTSATLEDNKDAEVFQNIKSEDDGFTDNFSSLEERLKKENNIVEEEPKKSTEVKTIVKELSKATPVEVAKPKPVTPSIKEVVKLKEEVKKQNTSVFDTLEVKKPSVKQTAAPKPEVKSKAPSTSVAGSYIQVYAGKNIDLKSHEIKKLDNMGLQYQVLTDSTGMSRVVVGPYSSADKAEALKYIRANVKKDAFYYRGKF